MHQTEVFETPLPLQPYYISAGSGSIAFSVLSSVCTVDTVSERPEFSEFLKLPR